MHMYPCIVHVHARVATAWMLKAAASGTHKRVPVMLRVRVEVRLRLRLRLRLRGSGRGLCRDVCCAHGSSMTISASASLEKELRHTCGETGGGRE